MGRAALISEVARASALETALGRADSDADFSLVDGLRVPLLAALLRERAAGGSRQTLLAITATSREADAVYAAFTSYLPDATVLALPAWETLPHERLSPSAETVGARLRALRILDQWATQHPGEQKIGEQNTGEENTDAATAPLIVVASVRAALQPLAAGLAQVHPIELVVNQRGYDLGELGRQLVALAYTRVDLVTRRGEFAVRGGILDVFAPDAEHPVRADFFGDELEQLREFAVADQRSLPEPLLRAEFPPSREMLLTDPVRQRAREMEHEFPTLAPMLAKIAEGIPVEGMESLAPALVDKLVPLTDYLPADAAIAVLGPERVAGRAVDLATTNREFLDAAWNAATAGAQAPIDLDSGDFLTVNGLREAAGSRAWWTLSPFDSGDDEVVRIPADSVPSFAGQAEGAVDHVAALLRDGWSVAVLAAGAGMVERAADVLGEREVSARSVDELPPDPEPGVAYLLRGTVEAGFQLPDAKFALLSEAEFYGRSAGVDARQIKRLASRRKTVVDPLQLKAGDYVVHATHGIGKFVELVQREVASGTRTPRGPLGTTVTAAKVLREYLVLEYAPSKRGQAGDRLYVPTDQLDLLTRYVGGEAPSLSKMGGSDWAAAKGKARKAVRDIAVELVKLYSARMASKGHAFPPDTPWQRELEEAFPFVETPDQLSTIDEVKADMERSIPMDRLISGDVGYGKTEIAIRAAFKAVQDGKQVAMLVPTTLLVRQHMETFSERFAGFPVHLRALSRFQSDKESKSTIEGLASGEVDVVIGTHRLLSDGIQFKDLGLVIIDEEQRFGVEHKDALKKLKTNVDILAMSATPIPRTLEMAVTGIREMSTLATPPEDRHPILTFVGPYSDKQVAAAIRRELLREGQVFFVHNRVSSINRVAAQIAELVPEARVGVAHGQLSESALERVIVDFWERQFDVLVTTTIIETGIDIANANTLIIDRADKYGLSQLHQIRGRVGRGRERAYAYFLYDDDKPLSELAQDRLGTLAANTELGGGMQIALKDLEIRGAGNLLGGEQSGHIAGVGFDLYLRMIGEAVSTFRGDVAEGQTELRLELPVDAHIPEDYIGSERLRLEAYQKLSTASAPASPDDALDSVVEELTDRYGELPPQVEALVRVSRLRRIAQKAGLSDVVAMGGNIRIAPADLADSIQVRLQRLYPGAKLFAQQKAISVPMLAGIANPAEPNTPEADAELVTWTTALLESIFPPALAEKPPVE
ncbi:MAG TPA: transcription-repair coupling factor [Pseudolysinimonas sp.]|nr:transcription-repair coupling factor [Pseudolysinimonas sp.]